MMIYGLHAVTARLKQQANTAEIMYALANRKDKSLQQIIQLAKQHHVKVQYRSRHELDELAQGGNHQGVVLTVATVKQSPQDLDELLDKLDSPVFLLILDGVQDPHNLGACLRSADAAGVDAVIAPKDNAVSITPTVRKVACGAAETMPFYQVTNLSRTIKSLQERGIWIYGLAGEATQSLYEVDFTGHIALVMGAEGKGLRHLTKTTCDGLVSLPLLGSVESLNVSVATGISLYEVVRQRR